MAWDVSTTGTGDTGDLGDDDFLVGVLVFLEGVVGVVVVVGEEEEAMDFISAALIGEILCTLIGLKAKAMGSSLSFSRSSCNKPNCTNAKSRSCLRESQVSLCLAQICR